MVNPRCLVDLKKFDEVFEVCVHLIFASRNLANLLNHANNSLQAFSNFVVPLSLLVLLIAPDNPLELPRLEHGHRPRVTTATKQVV